MTDTIRVQLTGTPAVFEVSSSGSRDRIDVEIPNMDILRLAPCAARIDAYRACVEPPFSSAPHVHMPVLYRLAALSCGEAVEELVLVWYQAYQPECAVCARPHVVYYPVHLDVLGGFIRWTLALTELTDSRIL